jgi:hypothetical protein
MAQLEQIPPKCEHFGDKDLLQHIDFARVLFGEWFHFAGTRAKTLNAGLRQDLAR